MMTTSKGGTTAPPATSQPSQDEQQRQQECCMCGDFGLSSELFRCKICQFRSQHRYCSNTYPKAESYRACNWCLNEKENSFNSSSSNKNATSTEDDVMKVAKKKSVHGGNGGGNGNLQRSNSSIKNEKGSPKLSVIIKNNRSIKKQKSPERSSPLLAARKRITTGSAVQESLRRTKSDVSNSGMRKHVFKNRVRRYKLLDEVSS
ncbi:uncharacterized protein LOC113749246 isoform X1 [Coffea eugenioides]|uniref:uncharacterized protein LOC113749246 isoform X1 n=1 Tax=Coffea eugenioides TaxID=49369 RepID=UPI000F606696|nr:uncharacterized protein LOC113749246 isoform X1 [Coffea eugenioides]